MTVMSKRDPHRGHQLREGEIARTISKRILRHQRVGEDMSYFGEVIDYMQMRQWIARLHRPGETYLRHQ
jgi:hypothetical protein